MCCELLCDTSSQTTVAANQQPPKATLKAALKAVVEDHLRVYATQTGLNALEEKLNK